ncbi:MAG: RNA polymerase sigma factor [Clostridia bacterium]|nr:RNA polymerase sigma factor [Clostridia bacterium]
MDPELQLNEAFERYYGRLFAYCLANLEGDEHAAMDAVDTVFLTAKSKAADMSTVKDPELWLTAIAKNVVRNIRKTEKRYKYRYLLFDPLSVSIEDQTRGTNLSWWEKRAFSLLTVEDELIGERKMSEEELGELKERLLGTLSGEERELFCSRYDDGVSTKQLAARMGISQDAVRARLTRISVKLVDRIKIYFQNQRSF